MMKKLLLAFVMVFTLVFGYSSAGFNVSGIAPSVAHAAQANLEGTDFMSAKDLKALVDKKDPNVIVVGVVVRGVKALMPGSLANDPIDGAYIVWRPDYSGKDSSEAIGKAVSGFRKSKESMEELLSKAGATQDSLIVTYSAGSMHDAVRFYWQIKQLGHKNVKILDGGIDAWVAAGYPTGDEKILVEEKVKTQYKAASYDTKAWGVTLQDVVAALESPDEWVVIDTRSQGEFDGKATKSSKGAFGTGGLKGAVHIEWKKALNKDNTLKSQEELKAIYGDAIKGKKVITLCQSGVRSAHSQAVIKELLGVDEVYNYDGSWIEWSYAASEASDGVVASKLKAKVKALTTNWEDNKKPI